MKLSNDINTIIFTILLLMTTTGSAADLCEAIAVRDTAAIQAPDSILAKGEYLGAITYYIENKQTQMTSFCSHGGYCYPSHVQIKNERVEALQLTNCKIGDLESENKEEKYYTVEIIREKISEEVLRHDDLENKLLDLELCSACADNAARFYIQRPSSTCAKLTKKALEGNPDATQKLQEFPDYCVWKY